jgi:hypothetical protein
LVICRIRRGGRKTKTHREREREREREKEEEEAEETVMKQLGLLPGCSFRKRNLQKKIGENLE